MDENQPGREAEARSLDDLTEEQPDSLDRVSGTRRAHDLPPNPEPAEGPRDKRFTEDTLSDDDQTTDVH